MKDPETPKIQDLLPELFGPAGKPFKPGGMCTPGSGCGPAVHNTPVDLLKVLTGSIPTPPAPEEGAGNPTTIHHGSEVAGPQSGQKLRA